MYLNDPTTAMSNVVQLNGNYYFVDSRLTFDHGYETMVFRCDENGHVLSWSDLYAEWYSCEEDMKDGHSEIIRNLGAYL